MFRIVALSPVSTVLRFFLLCLFLFALGGCSVIKGMPGSSWLFPGERVGDIERYNFPVAPGSDVVGRFAQVRVEEGDTLPDIARHFGLGLNAVNAANPGVDVWLPGAGQRVLLPLCFILPDAPRKGIVINLATMRLFEYKGNGGSLTVSTYPVGIGREDRPTPMGQMRVARKTARPTWHVPASIAADHRKKGDILPSEIPPGPENPLGEYAMYLSRAGYLIHGTNKPASIGLQATNGCMRLYPENIKTLFKDTPVNTPVLIVNQPYLIGKRNGVLYMEAHSPLEGVDEVGPEDVYSQLKYIEKKSGRTLDWKKIKEVKTEARGIPVPILTFGSGSENEIADPVEVDHPDVLYGKPEVPDLKPDAWYVLAADVHDETDALRLAAIINHQGPPIPARVLSKNNRYRVVAGPFTDVREAREANKRLKFDLEIDGVVIEPAKEG